ncbi:MAG: MoxR-like ATPase [Litorivivens sp.]|jgi:MoxR-like ATPase
MNQEENEYPEENLEPKDTQPSINDPEATPSLEARAANSEEAASWKKAQHVDVRPLQDHVARIRAEIAKVVVGQEKLVDLLLAGMFVGGHCLVEGLPGIAKTLTSKLLAQTISASYNRIQFTPDLMPTDITGTSVFNVKEGEFYFRKGPIFANIVLIDEINRAPAKTQAALMEVMEEKQITYDGETYILTYPFFVIATQNPVEQEGTYNLPEAQLDRFIFKINLDYPSLEEEELILARFENDFDSNQISQVKPVIDAMGIKECAQMIEKVFIRPELLKYIAAIIHNTRHNGDLYLGASPRASLSIMKASKAVAAIGGRDFVTPDDIKTVAYPVLNHRLIMSHEREMEGTPMNDIISSILATIEIPR